MTGEEITDEQVDMAISAIDIKEWTRTSECFLCGREMTYEDMNDCRSADLDYGGYTHNLCWNLLIQYAQWRASRGDPICWDSDHGKDYKKAHDIGFREGIEYQKSKENIFSLDEWMIISDSLNLRFPEANDAMKSVLEELTFRINQIMTSPSMVRVKIGDAEVASFNPGEEELPQLQATLKDEPCEGDCGQCPLPEDQIPESWGCRIANAEKDPGDVGIQERDIPNVHECRNCEDGFVRYGEPTHPGPYVRYEGTCEDCGEKQIAFYMTRFLAIEHPEGKVLFWNPERDCTPNCPNQLGDPCEHFGTKECGSQHRVPEKENTFSKEQWKATLEELGVKPRDPKAPRIVKQVNTGDLYYGIKVEGSPIQWLQKNAHRIPLTWFNEKGVIQGAVNLATEAYLQERERWITHLKQLGYKVIVIEEDEDDEGEPYKDYPPWFDEDYCCPKCGISKRLIEKTVRMRMLEETHSCKNDCANYGNFEQCDDADRRCSHFKTKGD